MLGDERFDRPQDFDLGVYWVSYLDDFQARCYIGTATVRPSPRGCRRLLGYVALAVVRAFGSTATAGGDEGWVEAVIPVEGTEHACCELLRLGGMARSLHGPNSTRPWPPPQRYSPEPTRTRGRWCAGGARRRGKSGQRRTPRSMSWGFVKERVTRIELEL
ncbi:WCX domain-containing protein [Streptomyces atroolivaceus]